MTQPEIIGSKRSTYTRAVCMVCEEKGIDYTLTEVLLDAPELRAIHPFGKMPVLRHGDLELFESAAISGYLDRSFGGPCGQVMTYAIERFLDGVMAAPPAPAPAAKSGKRKPENGKRQTHR